MRVATMAPDGGYGIETRLLDEGERERAARFHFERDRRSYVAAHTLLRRELSVAVAGETPPGAWRFRLGPYGRPEIDEAVHGALGLRFSISHTHDLAACAVLRGPPGTEIGIDAERIDREVELLELARRFFEPGEVAVIEALPEAERRLAFFRIWTLKEAVVKALGRGLSQDLKSFRCRLEPPGLAWGTRELEPLSDWHLQSRLLPSGHVLALATRSSAALTYDWSL